MKYKFLIISFICIFTSIPAIANEVNDWAVKGYKANHHGNYMKAVRLYTKAAERGHVLAQFNLGVMYREGNGIPENSKRGLDWITKAAEQGYIDAQLYLGGFYRYGSQAAKWYTKAAEQGHSEAQRQIGLLLENAHRIPKDIHKAIRWYTKSAVQGNAGAQRNLGLAYGDEDNPKIYNKKLSFAWLSVYSLSEGSRPYSRDDAKKLLTPNELVEAQEEATKIYERLTKLY